MKLALDTNAYKALGEGRPRLAEEVRRAEAVGLPIIVLGELWFGFMNGTKLRQNTDTLERFLTTPRVQILQLNEQTTRIFGEIATLLRAAGLAIQQNDIWIAALCKQHDYALATREQGFNTSSDSTSSTRHPHPRPSPQRADRHRRYHRGHRASHHGGSGRRT